MRKADEGPVAAPIPTMSPASTRRRTVRPRASFLVALLALPALLALAGAAEAAAPSAPPALGSGIFEANAVHLSWQAPPEAFSGGVTTYRVYRGLSSSTLTALVDVAAPSPSPTWVSYVDRNSVANDTEYFYRVTALDGADESTPSPLHSVRSARTPSAPTLVQIGLLGVAGAGGYEIYWNRPAVSGVSGALNGGLTHYNVYRGYEAGNETILIGQVGATAPLFHRFSFGDYGCVLRANVCHYRVAAVNLVGEGTKSVSVNSLPTAQQFLSKPGYASGGQQQRSLLDQGVSHTTPGATVPAAAYGRTAADDPHSYDVNATVAGTPAGHRVTLARQTHGAGPIPVATPDLGCHDLDEERCVPPQDVTTVPRQEATTPGAADLPPVTVNPLVVAPQTFAVQAAVYHRYDPTQFTCAVPDGSGCLVMAPVNPANPTWANGPGRGMALVAGADVTHNGSVVRAEWVAVPVAGQGMGLILP